MRLPRIAIENHQFTIVLIILLVLFGLVSFLTMPRSEDPQISPAGSSVVIIYPGANPADMEELIIEPIEEVINELEDIKDIKSTAEDGLAIVAVEFLTGSDPDEKYSDIVQKVNSIRNDLPQEILSLEITKWSISDVQIMQIALMSDTASYRSLEYEAEQLKKSFERIPGIERINILAYPEQEIRVSMNLKKMALYQIPFQQVIQAIRGTNQNLPGGYLDIGTKRFNVQTSGSYKKLQDIENTIIHAAKGKILYLRDIAKVNQTYEDPAYHARYDNKKALFITVSQKPGTNIFDIRELVEEKMNEYRTKIPAGIKIGVAFDQSESVSNRLNDFFINLLQGLILVGFVVLIAVGLRASIIVILVIPISIMIGIGLIDLSNFGLQQMTIAGMVIALGLLVDNAIVVLENISRFMRLGYDRIDAAIRGTEQIAWAVVSSTATTVLAFFPMMMIQSITGEFIRSMPVTVIYTLGASLLVSMILTPYLSSKYLSNGVKKHETYVRLVLNKFVSTHYRKVFAFALNHPKRVIIIALLIFFSSLSLFPLIGVSFFPKAEKPQFMINIDTPDGTNLEETENITRHIEDVLNQQDEIENFATNIGHGNPRVYYNVIPKNETSTHAQIFVLLKRYELNEFQNLLERLRNQFSSIIGAKIEVKEFEQGPPIEAPIAIRIVGDNLNKLKAIAIDVEKMIAGTPGTLNINNPIATSKTDLFININREKAGIYGVPLFEIDRTIRASIAGLSVSTFRDFTGKSYNIIVRLPFKNKIDYNQLNDIFVSSVTGAQIPLKQIANIEFKASPMLINHYNLERNVTLTADVRSGISVNQTTNMIIQKLNSYDWPKGYRYAVGGEQESREESFGGMLQAILVAMIAILGVLVLQFRSYSQPLIVFSAIPLALTGSFVALFITGYSFSFTAFVGLTSLVGIVVNNSIILVDYTNQIRLSGKDIESALKEACETRFMPIILTTATTVGGLLPLTLRGGTLWAPMGWTIIGGLVFSTFLTLIIVPVLYKTYTKPHNA
jgi:multidrug efflux pump subunit AcrB